jgi:hypothetical protein
MKESNNKFKHPMGYIEAASEVGKVSREHGIELETWLIEDVHGVVNGFKGYTAHNMNIDKDIPGKQYLKINGELLKSDILITNSGQTLPACIVESKGTINENMYGLLYFAKEYKKLGIPFCVVTKDTKGVFKTGKSKYLAFIKDAENIKLFINNHNNYDDTKEIFNWEDYSWNDYVRPYHEFNTYLFEVITKHYNENNSILKFT